MQRFSENDSTRWMTLQQVRWCLNMEKQDKIKKKKKKNGGSSSALTDWFCVPVTLKQSNHSLNETSGFLSNSIRLFHGPSDGRTSQSIGWQVDIKQNDYIEFPQVSDQFLTDQLRLGSPHFLSDKITFNSTTIFSTSSSTFTFIYFIIDLCRGERSPAQ